MASEWARRWRGWRSLTAGARSRADAALAVPASPDAARRPPDRPRTASTATSRRRCGRRSCARRWVDPDEDYEARGEGVRDGAADARRVRRRLRGVPGARRRGGPALGARPAAAQAHRRPACPTSTRATSSRTSRSSTPTTAARSTSTRAARRSRTLPAGASRATTASASSTSSAARSPCAPPARGVRRRLRGARRRRRRRRLPARRRRSSSSARCAAGATAAAADLAGWREVWADAGRLTSVAERAATDGALPRGRAVRVLILTWEYPPIVEGGLARHVRKLSEGLVRAGRRGPRAHAWRARRRGGPRRRPRAPRRRARLAARRPRRVPALGRAHERRHATRRARAVRRATASTSSTATTGSSPGRRPRSPAASACPT